MLKDPVGASFPLYVAHRNSSICSTLESEGSLFFSAIIVRVVVSGRFSARYSTVFYRIGLVHSCVKLPSKPNKFTLDE